MSKLVVYVGKYKVPIRAEYEFQCHRPAEEIDGLTSPEVTAAIDIKSLDFFGYGVDDILSVHIVENIRKLLFNHSNKGIL